MVDFATFLGLVSWTTSSHFFKWILKLNFFIPSGPQDIPYVYCFFYVIFVPLRWMYYRYKKWHYYLLVSQWVSKRLVNFLFMAYHTWLWISQKVLWLNKKKAIVVSVATVPATVAIYNHQNYGAIEPLPFIVIFLCCVLTVKTPYVYSFCLMFFWICRISATMQIQFSSLCFCFIQIMRSFSWFASLSLK